MNNTNPQPFKIVGIGTRVLNFLVDSLILAFITIPSYQAWNIGVRFYHFPFLNYWAYTFIILVIYYIFFETIFQKSPGKWLSYSQVSTLDNKKPSFPQIILRSIARVFLPGIFFIPFTDKTLHDILSNTYVRQD